MVYRGWLSGILLIATPAISEVLRFPTGEQFSELYILGPEHMAENYPFNIVVGQNTIRFMLASVITCLLQYTTCYTLKLETRRSFCRMQRMENQASAAPLRISISNSER